MGRPPLADGKARGIVFTLRLSADERDAIETAAEQTRKPVTQWAREILLEATRGHGNPTEVF
jgi:uncharacterized protein (DUF1778 family)